MTKKGKVFLGLGLFILIAGGTGAGLALFFTGVFDKKAGTVVNTTTPAQPQEVTEDGKDKIDPENLPINNSENSTPSKRNDISINCDYQRVWKDVNPSFGYWTYEERSKVTDKNNESISCVIELEGEKLNTYPVFTYDDIEDHLSFSSELYDFIVDTDPKLDLVAKATPKSKFTENNTFDQSKFDKEKQELAIKMLKKITSYIIDNTSFGAELSLMDTILFKPSDFSGEYRQIIQEERDKIFLSSEAQQTSGTTKRTISSNKKIMTLNPPDEFFRYNTDVDKNVRNFELTKDAFFEKDGTTTNIKFKDSTFEGVTFDVYQIQQTVSHEYGHHLVLHNKDLEQNRFFNTLKEITNPGNTNKKWNDFKTIYDYFNVIVETKVFNTDEKNEKKVPFTQWDIDKENGTNLPETATDILKLYRKHFSDNVQTVEKFLEDGEGVKDSVFRRISSILGGFNSDSSINNPTTNTIVKKLLPTNLYNEITDTLTSPVLKGSPGSQNTLANKIIDEIGKYKIYVNESFKLLPSKLQGGIVGSTYFLPRSFEKGTEGVKNVKPLTLGDVFDEELQPNIIKDGVKQENQDKALCEDQPLNAFALDSVNYEATLIYNSVGNYDSNKGALNFEDLSEQHDLDFMKLLSYYYSFDELSARLHGLLTFKDSLDRREVSGCSISYKVTTNNNKKTLNYSGTSVASNDYLADYALYKSFGIDVFEGDNEVKLYELLRPYKELENTNTIEFNKYEDPKNGESNLHYSYNSFGEAPKVGEKLTQTTEENANEEVKAWWTVYNLARVRLDDPAKAFLVTLEFDDKDGNKAYRKAQDYNYLNTFTYEGSKLTDLKKTEYTTENEVELLFYLYTARGLFSTDNGYRVADAPSIFNNAPTRVFVDNNGSGTFDEGDTLIKTV